MAESKRHQLPSHQKWVALGEMRVSPVTQRKLSEANPALRDSFNPDLLGHPVLSHRGTHYYIQDGQHRVEGYRRWIGEGWETQQLLCDVYEGLTEEEEADLFLSLNTRKLVGTFEKFRIAINADRPTETDIDRICRAVGLKISQQKGEGHVSAVATLGKVYARGGPGGLSRTLRVIWEAYGDPGLEAHIIDGIGLLASRFNGEVDDQQLVKRLSTMHAGADGLMQRAYIVQKQSGSSMAQCVAAAAVDIYNKGRGGKKLPTWWKSPDNA